MYNITLKNNTDFILASCQNLIQAKKLLRDMRKTDKILQAHYGWKRLPEYLIIIKKDNKSFTLNVNLEDDEDPIRTCSECGKVMTEGFVIEDGIKYYCTEECLHKNMTQEEYLQLYDNGEGSSYWTEWES